MTDTSDLLDRVSALVERETGIVVPPNPKFVRNRLARVDASVVNRALRAEPASLASLVSHFCTHETRFFREPSHFEFIAQRLAPKLHDAASRGLRPRHVRAWTAACSTGEEAYSLAMTLMDAFPRATGWTVEVLGTDISDAVLTQARDGRFSLRSAALIGADQLRRYMLKGSGPAEGAMCVSSLLSSCTRFERMNLVRPPYPVQGLFDVIFCRNVLFYFRDGTQRTVVDALSAHLRADGVLFTGHAESAAGHTPFLRPVAPATFALKNAA